MNKNTTTHQRCCELLLRSATVGLLRASPARLISSPGNPRNLLHDRRQRKCFFRVKLELFVKFQGGNQVRWPPIRSFITLNIMG